MNFEFDFNQPNHTCEVGWLYAKQMNNATTKRKQKKKKKTKGFFAYVINGVVANDPVPKLVSKLDFTEWSFTIPWHPKP